jgi:hypothetical protein
MFSTEPASYQAHTQQSGLCPHIIGQARLGGYHDTVRPRQRHRRSVTQSSALATPLMIHWRVQSSIARKESRDDL